MRRRPGFALALQVAALAFGCDDSSRERPPVPAAEDETAEVSHPPPRVTVDGRLTTIDLLSTMGLDVNAAGPILVRVDPSRDRVIAANTLSSSITVVDGRTDSVRNIPIGRRGLQHLKSEAMVIHAETGRVYLVADHALVVVDVGRGEAETYPTEAQFESVTVDPETGNAFFCGRERGTLGFYEADSKRVRMLPWLEHAEAMVNLGQTPPPPLRRVVAVPPAEEGGPARVAAIDGFEAKLHLFDARDGRALGSREIPLEKGGRWHLAGLDPRTRHVYLVTETTDRRAIQAGKIAVDGRNDVVVPLPEYTEPVGITFNPRRDEVYVPYDNHATLHVVDFRAGGRLVDVAIPAYGNDAAALDAEHDRFYLGSWAFGEIEIVDLAARRFVRRIQNQGIIPHMFAMAFDPTSGDLYFPVGASAVNGCFGASLTRLDPDTGRARTIRTGFAPIDLVEAGGRFLVFDNEDRMAEVTAAGRVQIHGLPHRYPLRAARGPEDLVYLAYGPHQSYWPVVYIWAARNGILAIDPDDLSFYDRRIPRQPLDLVVDPAGALLMPQNNWGEENQFLVGLGDGVRELVIGERLELPDKVVRETTQRILRRDDRTGHLYLVRAGEIDEGPSILQVVDPVERQVVTRLELGPNATDLAFDDWRVYVTSFDRDRVEAIDKTTWAVEPIPTGEGPLVLRRLRDRLFVLAHVDNRVEEIVRPPPAAEMIDFLGDVRGPGSTGRGRSWSLPIDGRADGLFAWEDRLVAVGHGPDRLAVFVIDPDGEAVELAFEHAYPFGDTRFDTNNSAFFMSGQFGDAVFALTRAQTAADGSLWLADFLSGKVFVLRKGD